jgi:hypothetical protein
LPSATCFPPQPATAASRPLQFKCSFQLRRCTSRSTVLNLPIGRCRRRDADIGPPSGLTGQFLSKGCTTPGSTTTHPCHTRSSFIPDMPFTAPMRYAISGVLCPTAASGSVLIMRARCSKSSRRREDRTRRSKSSSRCFAGQLSFQFGKHAESNAASAPLESASSPFLRRRKWRAVRQLQ